MSLKLGNYLILDVASAAIEGASTYIEGAVKAPSNYKDPDKIAAYIRDEEERRVTMAATDIDLARITGYIAISAAGSVVTLCSNDDEEREALDWLLREIDRRTVITYGGLNFDLPLLQRRAMYLGLKAPRIDMDRYRSRHVDLLELLSDRRVDRRRPLAFYIKRLGWTDLVKPLSGEEESKVLQTKRWVELTHSLIHDGDAVKRLAAWYGLLDEGDEQEPVVG